MNEDNVDEVTRILAAHEMDLPIIAAGLHPDPTYALGAFVNPDAGLRRRGIDTLRRGIDLCAQVGANFIIWPGAEGYNYTFQRPYAQTWRRFVEGVAELTDHANEKNVKVFLEHKNSEPAMKILMQNIGMTLFTIQKVNALGVDTTNLQVNMDWQHLIMNGENLAEYADLLASEHKLGHQHGNDGWGTFDDDNVVGTNSSCRPWSLPRPCKTWVTGRRARSWVSTSTLTRRTGGRRRARHPAVGVHLGPGAKDRPRRPGRGQRPG